MNTSKAMPSIVNDDDLQRDIAAVLADGVTGHLAPAMKAVDVLEANDALAHGRSEPPARETIDQAKARLSLFTSRVDVAESALIRGLLIARNAHGIRDSDFDVIALKDMRKVLAVASDIAGRAPL